MIAEPSQQAKNVETFSDLLPSLKRFQPEGSVAVNSVAVNYVAAWYPRETAAALGSRVRNLPRGRQRPEASPNEPIPSSFRHLPLQFARLPPELSANGAPADWFALGQPTAEKPRAFPDVRPLRYRLRTETGN